MGLDHHHQLGRGREGRTGVWSLLRQQVRCGRHDQLPGGRARRARHPGELGAPVWHRHPDGQRPLDVAALRRPPDLHSQLLPGALPTDSLADPDLVSDIVLWLASDASSLVTAAQIPADKGYLKI